MIKQRQIQKEMILNEGDYIEINRISNDLTLAGIGEYIVYFKGRYYDIFGNIGISRVYLGNNPVIIPEKIAVKLVLDKLGMEKGVLKLEEVFGINKDLVEKIMDYKNTLMDDSYMFKEEIIKLKKYYKFRNEKLVETFLKLHNDLPEILLDAVEHIKKIFNNPIMELFFWELVGLDKLVLGIQDPSYTIDMNFKLDEDWGKENLKKAKDKLVIVFAN